MKPLGFSVQQMRELLDALDVVRAAEASDAARRTARESLGEFAALAAAACDDMRAKVARGDELVQQLRRESQAEDLEPPPAESPQGDGAEPARYVRRRPG